MNEEQWGHVAMLLEVLKGTVGESRFQAIHNAAADELVAINSHIAHLLEDDEEEEA